MTVKTHADAIVVGGGLAGMAAAIALAKSGLHTILLAPLGPPDRRTSALMMPSVQYLQSAGLIDAPAELGHALTQIRIIDATGRLIRAPETLFDSKEAGLDAFGWNFANSRLLERFHAIAASLPNLDTRPIGVVGMSSDGTTKSVELTDGSKLTAALVVGADGKKSTIRAAAGVIARESNFTQSALVCDLELSRSIGGASIEFHYPNGPFTLVPAGDRRANLVWIDQLNTLQAAKAASPEQFIDMLMTKSQRLFGAITPVTPAHIFPLSTLHVDRAGADGVVLVGEAAHAFPPIGAQGLNLGLRDVADLAHVIADMDCTQPDWADQVSTAYANRRAADLVRTGGMVDTLFRSLLADMLPAQALRSGGLWALKLLPALRKQAFGIGMGGN